MFSFEVVNFANGKDGAFFLRAVDCARTCATIPRSGGEFRRERSV